MAARVSMPVEQKSPPHNEFPHSCFADIRRLPVVSPGYLVAGILRKGHCCGSLPRAHSRSGCLRGNHTINSSSQRRESQAPAASAPAGGVATYDPTVSRSPPATASPASEPLAEPGRGGGGSDGGWKSPPGSGGGGGGSGWWDGYSEWWENHNPLNTCGFLPSFVPCLSMMQFPLCLHLYEWLPSAWSWPRRLYEYLWTQTIVCTDWSLPRMLSTKIAVSLLNDFALVYLLAPTPECSVLQRGTIRAKLAELPAHVFQRAPLGLTRGYPLSARLACFLAKAMQYGTVGLVMGTTGSSLVLGLTFLRTALDKEYQPPPTYQPVLGTGLGWLLFMSGSSNVRYNLINLAEDLAYERFPGTRSKVLSIALRFSNNIFGAHAWMHMAKTLNLNRPRKQKRSRKLKPAPEGDLITEVPPAH